ncbi:recombinase family protein [Virgibacillus sp. DJP39]|uniref:recombinase family protein n=1 Tax=Virgibacillus sp. DJP39 TaxID=3409790 RepID=UPI003BB77095
MKTVAYLRSSSDLQENSIDTQKYYADECAQKGNLRITTYYKDESVSARKTQISERPDLSKLISEIESGVIENLIVYKRDRLARNVHQYLQAYEIIRTNGVNVYFSAPNEIPLQFSPAGEFFEVIMAGFNEREGNTIAERIRETKYSMAKKGLIPSGRPTFGYKASEKEKGK